MPGPTARLVGALAAAALVGAGCSGVPARVGVTQATPASSPPALTSDNRAATPPVNPPAGGSALADLQSSIHAVIDAVSQSVVQIDTGSGLGSGIVYDSRGDVVTNAHVVSGSQQVAVIFSDGHRYDGKVLGIYAAGDLAVVHVSGATGLKPAVFADSGAVRTGDYVVAIGSPLGLTGSVTQGIVSATGRSEPEGNGVTLNDLIQTDAAINPGNSGGALVNLSGEVIGMPTLGASSRQGTSGIGFAISSNQIRTAADQLIGGGTVTHTNRPYLGVSLSDDPRGGAAVASVVAGGPADRAGLKTGMTIVQIDSSGVADYASLGAQLARHKPGDKVTLGVRLADGSTKQFAVTLGEFPAGG